MAIIRTITIEWAVFKELEGRHLTCNPSGDVFVSRGTPTPNRNREFLQRKYPVLNEIAREVRRLKKGGGGFTIGFKGAFLVDGREQACRFKVANMPPREQRK